MRTPTVFTYSFEWGNPSFRTSSFPGCILPGDDMFGELLDELEKEVENK
jgi:hypothetical protein